MEKIVVGYDHSLAAQGALAWAMDYAGRSVAELIIVYGVSSAWEWELAAIQVNSHVMSGAAACDDHWS